MGQTEGGVTAVIVTEPAGLRGLHPRPSNARSGCGAVASRNWWQFAISDPPRGGRVLTETRYAQHLPSGCAIAITRPGGGRRPIDARRAHHCHPTSPLERSM
jgi:hypothetical protein